MARLRSTYDTTMGAAAPHKYAPGQIEGGVYGDVPIGNVYDDGDPDTPNDDPRMPGDPGGEGEPPPPPPGPPPPPPPNYKVLGQYGGRLRGWDMSKFTRPYDQWSEKYKLGGVFSHFNPNLGVSAELLAALNALDIGDFSGSGDNLNVKNARNGGRFGTGGDSDVVFGFDANSDQTAWSPWYFDDGSSGQGDVPPYVAPGSGGGGGYGGGGGSGSGGSTSQPMFANEIMDILRGLFPNGGFNDDIVNRRVSNVSDTLNRNRKSQMSTNEAMMGEMGQGRGDGTWGTSAGNLESRLGEQFNSSVNDIYATESENADSRMIQALQMATGMTMEEARNAVTRELGWGNINLGYRNADISEMLGLGNLALGNSQNANQYNLGLANIGLGRDQLRQQGQNTNWDRILKLLELWLRGQESGSNGGI